MNIPVEFFDNSIDGEYRRKIRGCLSFVFINKEIDNNHKKK